MSGVFVGGEVDFPFLDLGSGGDVQTLVEGRKGGGEGFLKCGVEGEGTRCLESGGEEGVD